MTTDNSVEEMEIRHKKEYKALEGEKRATLKKTKSTAGKGKKAKEKMASVETEFDVKFQQLKERQEQELLEFRNKEQDKLSSEQQQQEEEQQVNEEEEQQQQSSEGQQQNEQQSSAEEREQEEQDPSTNKNNNNDETMMNEDELKKQRKLEKARRKREKVREKERQRQLDIENETKNAGPSLRQIEMEQIEQKLNPLGLKIMEIPADGHCLYRAIAAQVQSGSQSQPEENDLTTFEQIRHLCAQTLQDHEEDYAPFCEYTDTITNFQEYVNRVRNSADWGGHIELRALSTALQRTIYVYSAQQIDPLIITCPTHTDDDDSIIRLSYHLHYYALGEHYNHIVPTNS